MHAHTDTYVILIRLVFDECLIIYRNVHLEGN